MLGQEAESHGKPAQAKLAACVNIIPQVKSCYWWDGKIEESQEQLLMIKTRQSLVPELTAFVTKNHPYEVAEVITTEVRVLTQVLAVSLDST